MWHICCRQCWLLQLAGTGKLAEGNSGARRASTVQALNSSKLGTSVSALEVSSWWFKLFFNIPVWTLALGSHRTKKKMCIWLWVERSAWAIFSCLKKQRGIWFGCFVPQKSGAQGRKGNSCPLQFCSSNLGTTSNCCAHANATTWAWAWPHSVLAYCWVFPL